MTRSRADIRNFIEQENTNNDITVWSKTTCPYCHRTKQLLSSVIPNSAKSVKVIELDRLPDGYLVQQELYKLTGQRTVPNVFVQNEHLGGNSETAFAHANGDLYKRLNRNQVKSQ